MSTLTEVEERLEVLLSELKMTTMSRRQVCKLIEQSCPDILHKIREAEEEIDKCRERVEFLRTQLSEQSHEFWEDKRSLEERETEIRSQIKNTARSLRPEDSGEGLRIDLGGGWRVSVSKVPVHLAYKSEELLHDHPHLASIEVDGDPLVTREVNSVILGRLVASGEIDESTLTSYTTASTERAPTVRIFSGEDNE